MATSIRARLSAMVGPTVLFSLERRLGGELIRIHKYVAKPKPAIGSYRVFSSILGKPLLEAVERRLGGRIVRINKSRLEADVERYRGKPMTVRALAKLLGKSTGTAHRMRKILE